MNIRTNLKYIWLAIGVLSLIFLAFDWFGFDSERLQNAILVLNALGFILSLPCSLFVLPVVFSANYFMAIGPLSPDGVYINTFFLFVVGLMQWFWIAGFWSPAEPQLQTLDLPDC